jgi:hypothetical protein
MATPPAGQQRPLESEEFSSRAQSAGLPYPSDISVGPQQRPAAFECEASPDYDQAGSSLDQGRNPLVARATRL